MTRLIKECSTRRDIKNLVFIFKVIAIIYFYDFKLLLVTTLFSYDQWYHIFSTT